MPYDLQIDEAVVEWIDSDERGFTAADVATIYNFIDSLANISDVERDNHRCPNFPSSLDIDFHFVNSEGRWMALQFGVSDAAAAFGILRVIYLEFVQGR